MTVERSLWKLWRADMSARIYLLILFVQSITHAVSGLYVSEKTTSESEAASSCNLATPDIHFGRYVNTVPLDGADLNIAERESVWSGYVQTYAAFLYEGCCDEQFANSLASHTDMYMDQGACYSKCKTEVIGMQSVLYVSDETATADTAATLCNLATPDIHFGKDLNTVSLDDANLNIDDGESVWSGYVQTYAAFLYEGCYEKKNINSNKQQENVFMDPGECYSICNTDVIGMQTTTCHCNPRPADTKTYATECYSPCSNPADTDCGGKKAVSIYRKVKYPVPVVGKEGAEDENCRALFWKNHGQHFYSWRDCSKGYHVMCATNGTSSKFEFYKDQQDWNQSAGQCFEKGQIPAAELPSGFPDLNVSTTFDNLIWIGQIRSRVIGKELAQNDRTSGWRRGYIVKNRKNFELKFGTVTTTAKSLCENVSALTSSVTTTSVSSSSVTTQSMHLPSLPTVTADGKRNNSDQQAYPDEDSQFSMTSTSTKSSASNSDLSRSSTMHPTSLSPTTNAKENRNRSDQKANLDDDPQFPMIAVYIAVPVVSVLVVVVVIWILCKRRKYDLGKNDDPTISQENAHNIPRSRSAVSNASYQDCDVRHEYFPLEPLNDYAMVSDVETNAPIDDEYDTTTHLRANANDTSYDTDNVYNKLEDLTDDTYNHTNTAAASVDNTYDKATYGEHEATYNTTSRIPGSKIGNATVTDSEYSTLNSYNGN